MGSQHITLIDGYLRAIQASPAVTGKFDLVLYASQRTYDFLSADVRQALRHKPIPVMNGEKRRLVLKSLLEFFVTAGMVLCKRREDVVFISCLIPPAFLMLELVNKVLGRRGVYLVVHDEVEGFFDVTRQNIKSYGFWILQWLRIRNRTSGISLVVIDDFIKERLLAEFPDKLGDASIKVAHHPISPVRIAGDGRGTAACFIGYRTKAKGFEAFKTIAEGSPSASFVAIGGGKVENVTTGETRSLSSSDDYLQAVGECAVAVFPYVSGYSCSLSAAALDAMSTGVHMVATHRGCFDNLSRCLGPDFVTLFDDADEVKALMKDKTWLRDKKLRQAERLELLALSKYGLRGVSRSLEELILSSDSAKTGARISVRSQFREALARAPIIDGLFRRFVWSRIHFPEVEMRFINALPAYSIDVAIDVGAAMGNYSWILNEKARKVYAFEPGEYHADYLAPLMFGTRIELIRAAVGSSAGKVNMFTPGNDKEARHSATLSASNPVTASNSTAVRVVEQVSLDSYFADRLGADQTVDLIKIDVEGYELEVFVGGKGLIATHRPLVFCEIEARHNALYGKVFDLMRGLGYQAYFFRDGEFEKHDADTLEQMQMQEDLAVRLSGTADPQKNRYINNFIFQHPQSRLKVVK